MPLDVHCPSCRTPFPVTNAGSEFHVECPSCDAGVGITIHHPNAGKIGSVPQASARLAEAPASSKFAPLPVAKVFEDDEDDDKATRRKGSGSAWVVILGSGFGLLLVLAGLGTTGYFLFTNLDTHPRAVTTAKGNASPRIVNNIPPTITPTPPQTNTKTPQPGGILPTRPTNPAQATSITIPPATVTPVAITPNKMATESGRYVSLPGRVEEVRVAGGGRFLLMSITEPRKLIVFDLSEGRVTAETSLDRDLVSLAGGMNKAVVAYPGRRILRHYKLPDLTPDGESPILLRGQQTTGIAMGSATNGPLFLVGLNEIALVDLESKKVVEGSSILTPGFPTPIGSDVRASHNGSLFTVGFASRLRTFRVENGQWVEKQATIPKLPVPGADGTRLYGEDRIYTADGKPVGRQLSPTRGRGWFVPATQGPEVVKVTDHMVEVGQIHRQVTFEFSSDPDVKSLWDRGTLRLFKQSDFDIFPPYGHPLSFDKLVFFSRDAQVLAILAHTRDKIELRRINVE